MRHIIPKNDATWSEQCYGLASSFPLPVYA
jgi:hypothetical protein